MYNFISKINFLFDWLTPISVTDTDESTSLVKYNKILNVFHFKFCRILKNNQSYSIYTLCLDLYIARIIFCYDILINIHVFGIPVEFTRNSKNIKVFNPNVPINFLYLPGILLAYLFLFLLWNILQLEFVVTAMCAKSYRKYSMVIIKWKCFILSFFTISIFEKVHLERMMLI